MRNKKFAFTMAEVLITLGVVGVVAVLTLPSVIQKQKEKITVNRLKSAYSIISQAFARTISENGTPDTWGMGGMYESQSQIIMGNAFVPYLKISKNCIGQTQKYTMQNCDAVHSDTASYSSIVLGNGMTLLFRSFNPNCTSKQYYPETCGYIFVDINGRQKPNESGKDRFGFWVTKTKIVPSGTKGAKYSFNKYCNLETSEMSACTAWVLYNENMDYLHCTGLDWNSKTKCK